MKLLFIDKVLSGPCKEPPRGVELFNLRLLGELATEGISVTALVHPSWNEYLADAGVACLYAPSEAGNPAASVRPTRLLQFVKRGQYDILLVGNVANRLIGFILGARHKRICKNCVVIAHREPSRRVLWAQKVWPSSVIVAVNRQIAGHYQRAGFSHTSVYYGVTGAEAFRPAEEKKSDGFVDFCVVGNMENAWKGADTAIAAFRLLPKTIQANCRLHLASYHQIPTFPEANIIPYGWMEAEAIPAFLSKMDVMVVPSRDENVMRETFSQVMVQGMLSGLPVITTDLPILTEKLDNGGGLVTRTIQEMAAAMQRLAENPALRQSLGAEARVTASDRYTWDTAHFVQQYLV